MYNLEMLESGECKVIFDSKKEDILLYKGLSKSHAINLISTIVIKQLFDKSKQ